MAAVLAAGVVCLAASSPLAAAPGEAPAGRTVSVSQKTKASEAAPAVAKPPGPRTEPTREPLPASGAGSTSPALAPPEAPPASASEPDADGRPRSSIDQQSIRRNRATAAAGDNGVPSTAPASGATSGAAPAAPAGGFETGRVVVALAAVLGLAFVLRWVSRKFFVLPGAHRSTRAVQVLSRSPLTPKQQLMLVQVGRRVIVVADCGTQMNALCQIDDPDEVAALIGQIRSERTDAATTTFGSMFGRVRGAFESETAAGARSEVEPRGMSDRLGPRRVEDEGEGEGEGDGDGEEVDTAAPDRGADPAVASTRNEINGLMEKVRLLSRQFKGT